ncbi:2'-5' RNA ligase family protein, partial [Rhizobium sp. Pop5]|uniref:2'-5' RNA ligase family protein n=1 Tax=Rhizobium sp. Pop5 TaxID=1223565 RepID=UPI000283AAE7
RQCCAFHLQYFPETTLLSKLGDVQDRIERHITAPLLRLPIASLHMTVVTLIDAIAHFTVPNHEVWKLRGGEWKEIIDKLVEKTPPFDLEFSEVATSEAAVFIKAAEPPGLHELRSAISDAICFEDRRPRPPQIAHITLFRFSAAERISKVNLDIGFTPIGITVRSLQLLEERVYPSIEINKLSAPLLQGRAGETSRAPGRTAVEL